MGSMQGNLKLPVQHRHSQKPKQANSFSDPAWAFRGISPISPSYLSILLLPPTPQFSPRSQALLHTPGRSLGRAEPRVNGIYMDSPWALGFWGPLSCWLFSSCVSVWPCSCSTDASCSWAWGESG